MISILEKYALYIAPRIYEGIGMSFLKAMALGRCVIAVDNPTMNEYIQHGNTGLLFDINNTESIHIEDFDIKKIQKNTIEYMNEGYLNFKDVLKNIPQWIENSPLI